VKTLGAVTALLLLGFVCGLTVATLNVAFEPRYCGEDCTNTAWASLLTWMPACTVAFPTIGMLLWPRGGRTWRRLLIVALALMLLVLAPAGAVYLYRAMHQTVTGQ
jgi:hypothetical protein